MAGYRLLLAALVVCLLHQTNCQTKSRLSISPNPLELTPEQAGGKGASVTVQCQPPVSNNAFIFSLKIFRTKPGSAKTLLVTTDPPSAVATTFPARLVANLPGFSANGSKEENSIMLTMAAAKCDDAAEYECEVSVANAVKYVMATDFKVDVKPNKISLTPLPLRPDDATWEVNETLTITCNGIVGSVKNKSEIKWAWDYQPKSDFPTSSSVWYPYTDKYNESDIRTENLRDETCYKRQTSVLVRKLQVEDSNRVFRCFVIRNGIEYKTFAQITSVGTVSEKGANNGGNPNSSEPSKANVGAIVGGIFGGLIVIIVIIVLVYFLVIRRRKNADKPETYDANDKSNKPNDATGPPGYSSQPDPSVAYSAPNRFRNDRDKPKRGGQTNTAMDEEPDDKSPTAPAYESKPSRYESKPARYENDFNQRGGRRNPSYDYDNRGRHYSSDDGGSNMNTSMHSLGDGDPTIGTAI